ncbi:MAG: succinylglutamate desuccinylase/aspartoacylase family protein [Phycisphaerales bacterium]
MTQGSVFTLAGKRIAPGTSRDVEVPVGESATGREVTVPTRVWRGSEAGPTVAITAAVHGDEIIGMGIVRQLLIDPPFELRRGTLVLVPVMNILGFERQSRYMPDRRDLNRSFPGSATGSLTARFAHAVFDQIVRRADWLIDLHAAAAKRTNYPNVRADLNDPRCAELAHHFAASLTVHGRGPEGSLRRAAVDAGVPAIILEAGEVWKFEPRLTEAGVRGIVNALHGLGMIEGGPVEPSFRAVCRKTEWLRADQGGILRFHVGPGEDVDRDQPVATVTTVLGRDLGVITAPGDGIVLGMTTMPSVVPGDPVCHLATVEGGIDAIRRARRRSRGETLDERVRDDLATNLSLEEHDGSDAPDAPQPAEG